MTSIDVAKFGIHVLLCIISIGMCVLPCCNGKAEECSPGLVPHNWTRPVCPDSLLTYTCIVAGTNNHYTEWTGPFISFLCHNTTDTIIVPHNQNNDSVNERYKAIASKCDLNATLDTAKSTDGCYVTHLQFEVRRSLEFEIGIDSIFCLCNSYLIKYSINVPGIITNQFISANIVDPPSSPQKLRLSSCNPSSQTLTLMWDKPASNGGSEIERYGVTVEPAITQCSGICYFDANTTHADFGPLKTNTYYTFTVHAEKCAGTLQGNQSNITVFYGGPAGHIETTMSLVYQKDELNSIVVRWKEEPLQVPTLYQCSFPVTGFELSYISYFTDAHTIDMGLENCLGGTCSHEYGIADFDIPMYTVTLKAKNEFGVGLPTVLDLIKSQQFEQYPLRGLIDKCMWLRSKASARNNLVKVIINATTPHPEAICQFMCGFKNHSAKVQCKSIQLSTDFGEINEPDPTAFSDNPWPEYTMYHTEDGLPAFQSKLSANFAPKASTVYYYQVAALIDDQVSVTINGNFTTGNYSADPDKDSDKPPFTDPDKDSPFIDPDKDSPFTGHPDKDSDKPPFTDPDKDSPFIDPDKDSPFTGHPDKDSDKPPFTDPDKDSPFIDPDKDSPFTGHPDKDSDKPPFTDPDKDSPFIDPDKDSDKKDPDKENEKLPLTDPEKDSGPEIVPPIKDLPEVKVPMQFEGNLDEDLDTPHLQ